MKRYLLHWLDGRVEEVSGTTIADALTHAGYSAGALRALDYFQEIKEEKINA